MSYRYDVAITMLQKDWDELREFVKTIKNDYARSWFDFSQESPSVVQGIKCVTLIQTCCYWRPEDDNEWAGILMKFLDGDKENDYDDGQRPYKILVLGEELDDNETYENRVDYGGVDGLDNMLPYEAAPYIRREFAFWN